MEVGVEAVLDAKAVTAESDVDASTLVRAAEEVAVACVDRSEVAGIVAGRDVTTVPTGRVNTAASSSQLQPEYPKQQ